MNSLNIPFFIAPVVASALSKKLPVLALESTIIAHGMPYPENIEFAQQAEAIIRKHGVVPATIAIINGESCIGLDDRQLELLSNNNRVEKITVRDIAFAITQKLTGATTVSVVGFGTNEFPAFYSRSSGSFLANSCNTPEEVAELFITHRKLKLQSAILVANPILKSDEIPRCIIDKYIDTALKECDEKEIVGKNVTLFLLKKLLN